MSKKKKNKDFNYRPNSKRNKREKQKSNPQKVPPISNLEQGKAQLNILFIEANERIQKIQSQGFVSYALYRVETYNDKDYFDINDVKNKDDLLKELTRVRVFLNDNGSTLDGAILDTAQINGSMYKGKFGNQYYTKEHNYAKYDTTVIDRDLASRAFETYRKLESSREGEIRNDGGYGSENLINIIYDAEVRGLDSLIYATDILDTFIKKDEDEWGTVKRQSDNIAMISGNIDNIVRKMRF